MNVAWGSRRLKSFAIKMARLKIAKLLFFVAALSFVARPFFGYALFSTHHNPDEECILVKIFSKRKPELSEESNSGLSAIEKKLANANLDIPPCFDSFLDVLFPTFFAAGAKTNTFRPTTKQFPPKRPVWLLCSKIVI